MPFGDEEVEVVDVLERSEVREGSQQKERFIVNDFGMRLTETCLRSLEGKNWIEDEVIDFAYCQLALELMSTETLDLVLVLPNVAHVLTNLSEHSVQPPLDIEKNSLFLFPLNNRDEHEQTEGGSGAHWSLIVLQVDKAKKEFHFVHHDTITNMNRGAANRLVSNLANLFPSFHCTSREGPTPKQVNGYDCGVYLIAISSQIASWYKKLIDGKTKAVDWTEEISKISPEMISKRRQDLLADLKKMFSFQGNYLATCIV